VRRTAILIGLGALLGSGYAAVSSGAALRAAYEQLGAEHWIEQGLTGLAASRSSALRAAAAAAGLGALGGALLAWVGALRRQRWLGGRFVAALALAGGALAATLVGAEVVRTRCLPLTQPAAPHMVWIVIDTLRADHLGCYGYEHDTSPWIDGLAARGVRFARALSQESYTLASVASFFTSTYPVVHGVLYDEPAIDVLPSGAPTVAEVLADRGYATAAFVFNPHLQARFRFDQGFEVYDDSIDRDLFGPDPRTYEQYDTAQRMERKVRAYLERRVAEGDERPLALYLHYRDVHGPYVPPPPYHEMFAPRDWSDAQRALALRAVSRRESEPAPPAVADVDFRKALYDGEIRYTDEHLARLFELLASHGLPEDELVVVLTADHGEEFQDRHPADPGGWNHGRTLYVEQVHVPLIVRAPGASPGLVVEQPVELLDIGPTLVDLAGAPGDVPLPFQGRSLLPLLRGRELPARPVFSGGNHGRGLVVAGDLAYYRSHEATRRGGDDHARRPDSVAAPGDYGVQLFDLEADPQQRTDLSRTGAAQLTPLAYLLDQWLEQGGGGSQESASLDPETAAALRALGYLGGDG